MSKKTAVIVIPTYNEAGNIAEVLFDLDREISNNSVWNINILVVDAASPDGTASIVKDIQSKIKNLHLLIEDKKEGIGAAYFKGFNYAINAFKADAIIEFDGDAQHPANIVPEMLAQIDAGYDLVLGSRRIKGGSYPYKWDKLRLFFSRFGGFVARFILFFPGKVFARITDPTTGLKATKVNTNFLALDFANFTSKGFGYKIEMLFKLIRKGDSIIEVPMLFKERGHGESKMDGQTPFEVLSTAFKIRLKDESTIRFIRFGIVGFSGYIVNSLLMEYFLSSFWLKDFVQLFTAYFHLSNLPIINKPVAWAAGLAVQCSIINNFLWDNLWTFRKRRANTIHQGIKKFFAFNLTSIGAILIQFFSVGLATHLLGNTIPVRQLTLVLTIIFLIIPYNWFIYNHVIWRK